MAELHRYGIGAVAITHGATRAALRPLAPPTPEPEPEATEPTPEPEPTEPTPEPTPDEPMVLSE